MTTRTGMWFTGLLGAVGLLTGLVIARAPSLLPIPMPYFLVPLGAGLLLDLVVQARLRRGVGEPVTSNERAGGVLGGAVLAFVTASLLAR